LTSFRLQVHYWERLGLEIPYVAMEVAGQREKYRVLRENVLLVVRDYNKVRNTREKRPGRLEEGSNETSSA
jgi:dynein heavy chain